MNLKQKIKILLAAISLQLALTSASLAYTNLLQNPGFEAFAAPTWADNVSIPVSQISPWILGQGDNPNLVRVNGGVDAESYRTGPKRDASSSPAGVARQYFDIVGRGNRFYQSFTSTGNGVAHFGGYFSSRDNRAGSATIQLVKGVGFADQPGNELEQTRDINVPGGDSVNDAWRLAYNTATLEPNQQYSLVVIFNNNNINFDEAFVSFDGVSTVGRGVGQVKIMSQTCPTIGRKGKIKVKYYSLAPAVKVKLTLEIRQNTSVIQSLTQISSLLGNNISLPGPGRPNRNRYHEFELPGCIQLRRTAGFDFTKGFDYSIKAEFIRLGSVIQTRYIGVSDIAASNSLGVKPGLNNDCPACFPSDEGGPGDTGGGGAETINACCPDYKCFTSSMRHKGTSTYSLFMSEDDVTSCIKQVQAYANYLNSLDPNITGIALHWKLVKSEQPGEMFHLSLSVNGPPPPGPTFTAQINANQNGITATPTFNGLVNNYVYRLSVRAVILTSNGQEPYVTLPKKCSGRASSQYYWNQSKMLINGKPAAARKSKPANRRRK